MAADDQNFSVWSFIKGIGKLLIGFLLVVQGLIGLVVMIMVVSAIIALSNGFIGDGGPSATVPDGAALYINPNGVLVEQAEPVDPFEQAFQEAYGVDEPGDISVHDLVRAIREAAGDDRIKGIVLDLSELSVSPSSASKVHYVAAELEKFKQSGKTIQAVGDVYGQDQYLMAASADTVYLHDRGSLVFFGYGRYVTYFKSFLDKIRVTPHVFRVGTFKAAVEPFLRDDMSDEARAANADYLDVLWSRYANVIEEARGLDDGAVDQFANSYNSLLAAANGDMAQAALDFGLVDELKSRPEQLAALKDLYGEDKEGETFKNVEVGRYLTALGPREDGEAPNVAVVTAAGTIIDGEAPAGVAAAGDTIAGYLEKAREDDDVKAVVLRVDSPGGSAFASEVIRDQVIALKEAGKPVVVSMGSLAASGGYWISAPADEIWAAPTTITGSIGIFAFFPTFENAFDSIGIHVDGVGTTAFSSLYGTGAGPLNEPFADVIQQSVEHGYREFLSIVADGRDLDSTYVDSIAQGRVWIGERAMGLRLVDKLGGLDEAVAAAAARAGLEEYDRVEVLDTTTPFEMLFGGGAARVMRMAGVSQRDALAHGSALRKAVRRIEKTIDFYGAFNDPHAMYARCLSCGG
ncbi:MAG: signal peptide peptidase SppA [Pseudomonadota bacterium]